MAVLTIRRSRFNPQKYLRDVVYIEQRSKNLGKMNLQHGKMDLRNAVMIINQHLTERAQKDSSLSQDIIMSGHGDPLARERMKTVIDTLMKEYKIEINEHTLVPGWSASYCVFADTCGFSLVDDLVGDMKYEEIQIIDTDIYYIINGDQYLHERKFSSVRDVERLQERLALNGKKPINAANPFLQSYLYDGSRLVLTRPSYTDVTTTHIRHFTIRETTLDNMVKLRTINTFMQRFLHLIVKYQISILIGGGTNVGKTTMLFALCKEIEEDKRIRTLEKEFEINLRKRLPGKRNIVGARPLNDIETFTMEQAFMPLLVMSPHWIIVGEAKGSEISQAIQGALRGHSLMCTLHTNYRDSLISDIMDMVKMDDRQHEHNDVLNRIARAFPIAIFKKLIRIGNVNVRVVTEITHFYVEDGVPKFEPIFLWDYEKKDWYYTGADLSASTYERIIANGGSREEFAFLKELRNDE